MSFAAEITSAATEAAFIHAQLQGMSAAAAGNFYLGATPTTLYTGVFGSPQIQERTVQSGYTTRVVVPLTVPRTTLPTPPGARTSLTRVSPAQTYLINSVDLHDPVHYVFILVKTG